MRIQRLTAFSTLSVLISSCLTAGQRLSAAEPVQTGWRAEQQAVISGFKVPECALYDSASDSLYVSNIESSSGNYWSDDGAGHISLLGPDNRIRARRWADSTPPAVINAPKGMCVLGKYLYFTDNSRLMRCSITDGKNVQVIASGFKRLNDLATDGKNVWVSDTATGEVYCVSPAGQKRKIPAPPGVNGLTFYKTRLFAVSWSLHDLYELDPAGEERPKSFGLAKHFTNLDGIEVLNDGTFVVSDFEGNKISSVSGDRSAVHTLIKIPTPADIGLNREKDLLYIPLFTKDKLAVYRLEHNP